ncbi:dihydrolipoamide acetyltransferase [Vitiosangium sp. GDMCC 1.1324]|uniref:dihydrolipoamide acetyltransferase n=1 Tax=Vitiosangium sp. (strain GDMCC 1.1324) TaxID=2138576 RepID=UPI000D36F323|nr:dihydrolipoamide acetyltransferase [Vitiosangium sp. GDMCC 1.1324]PTL79215.1 dihydrolipoamide acetyltransferase [Vitiosangium sp. GDMCC 1.1324]
MAPTLRVLALVGTALWAPASFAQTGPGAASTPAPTASPAPASSKPAAPAASGTPAQTADEAFNTRVRTLEEQVVDLKEKVFRSKARLQLLQETVLGGDLSTGARAVLFHRNEMGDSFVLESVAYALDGAPIFTRTDENGDLAKRPELEIFNGRIVPGQHQVAVRLVYRGHGYGVFSYLEGYRFKVQSSYTFNAEPGKVTTVRVVGFEKGGLTTDLQDRPAVRYDIESARDTGKPKPAPASDAAAPPPAATAPTETK